MGNADIRDYNAYIWTNTINGTTTQNVWNNGLCASTLGHRLDMQTIALPAQFLGTRLDSIRFTDTGADNVQRMVLHGVTLDADPVLVTAGVAPGIAAPAPMQAYPNPAGGAFRLRLGARAAAWAVTVELVDVRGRRVGRSLVAPAGATELAIDPAALGVRPAPGLYFARIAGEPRGAARIVVLR